MKSWIFGSFQVTEKRREQPEQGRKRQKDLRTVELLTRAPEDEGEREKLRSCLQAMETADMLAFRISKFALKVLNQVRNWMNRKGANET